MFSLFNLSRRKLFVLGIVRCDKLHTYALLRGERDSRVFFVRCTKFDPCRRSGKEHCVPLNVLYTSLVPFLVCHVYLDYPYIFEYNCGCKQYQKFYFYVSIHCSLFREMVCPRIWATKMWGRGIMCTSLEINQIFSHLLGTCLFTLLWRWPYFSQKEINLWCGQLMSQKSSKSLSLIIPLFD